MSNLLILQRSESPTFARVGSRQSREEEDEESGEEEPLVVRDMESGHSGSDSDQDDITSRDTSVTVIV